MRLACRLFVLTLPSTDTVIGVLSLGLIIRQALRYKNNDALIGAVIFGAAGLLGLSGEIGGFNKADIFHVSAAISFYLLSKALRKISL